MSLLGTPLEQDRIREIRRRFPGFNKKVPDEAKYWSEGDLEEFFKTNGETRPQETSKAAGQTCPLLSRIRVRLAEEGVSESTAEYRSFCRRFREVSQTPLDPGATECSAWKLQGVAECCEVEFAKRCPRMLRGPIRIEKPNQWAARMWNMDFWKRECGDDTWTCRTRFPVFEDDDKGADSFAVGATVAEYINYAKVVQRSDRKCDEDSGLSFPRLGLEGWMPFYSRQRQLLAESWERLRPAGLRDLSPRWVEAFAGESGLDSLEQFSRLFKVSIEATGTICRLHSENGGAHAWLNQIEGRRLYFLFPPKEDRKLYAVSGGPVKGVVEYALRVGLVDVLYPSLKRHPEFAEARAQMCMLYMGQTLIIPSGWWWYSVALEPSVTLHHPFWNLENKVLFTEGLRHHLDLAGMPKQFSEIALKSLESVHERVVADDESEDEDD